MSQQDGSPVDPEHGESTEKQASKSSPTKGTSNKESPDDLDEFGRIFKYVSTHRDDGGDEMEEEEEMVERRLWYAPWKKRKLRTRRLDHRPGQFPEEWRMTDIRQGLSTEEASNRRRDAGWNELVSEKVNPIAQIIGYFRGPILYGKPLFNVGLFNLLSPFIVMELAVILSAGLEDWVDFGVIIGILCMNAAVGWYQEKQAADVVASLKGDIAMRVTAVRDGEEKNILARELVPGDVVGYDNGFASCLLTHSDRLLLARATLFRLMPR